MILVMFMLTCGKLTFAQIRISATGWCGAVCGVVKYWASSYRRAMFQTLEDFSDSLSRLPSAHSIWRDQAIARQKILTKPPGALGRLEDIAIFLAGWGSSAEPRAEKIDVLVFAGNHGVTAQGVSPYPPEVTTQMVANFEAGGAAINAITTAARLGLHVIPLKLNHATNDITASAAMDEDELLEAPNAGAAAVRQDADIIALGEMGIGNTTIAAALAARSLGGTAAGWVGPGTGLDGAGVKQKTAVVERALALHERAPMTAIETLRRVGGRETAAVAGAIVAARHARIPVLLDGYVVAAGLAPLTCENALIVEHCIAGHVSAEPAHRKLLRLMALEPILDLGMRLGEGTGAAVASGILRAACAAHNNMATFAQAGVSNRDG